MIYLRIEEFQQRMIYSQNMKFWQYVNIKGSFMVVFDYISKIH